MPKLNEAVRIDIANCSEKAYESLSVKDCAELLFFKNGEKDISNFISNTERSWSVRENRVYFADSSKSQVRVPSKQLIESSLSYANELERIVQENEQQDKKEKELSESFICLNGSF